MGFIYAILAGFHKCLVCVNPSDFLSQLLLPSH